MRDQNSPIWVVTDPNEGNDALETVMFETTSDRLWNLVTGTSAEKWREEHTVVHSDRNDAVADANRRLTRYLKQMRVVKPVDEWDKKIASELQKLPLVMLRGMCAPYKSEIESMLPSGVYVSTASIQDMALALVPFMRRRDFIR